MSGAPVFTRGRARPGDTERTDARALPGRYQTIKLKD